MTVVTKLTRKSMWACATVAVMALGSCSKKKDDDANTKPVFVPLTSSMTLSFASTAAQKKAALELITLVDLPASVSAFKMGPDGSIPTTAAVKCKPDTKGNCTIKLDAAATYVIEASDSSGKVTHKDALQVPNINALPAAKRAEARGFRVENNPKKVEMMSAAVKDAKKKDDRKPVANQKADGKVASLVDIRAVAKSADAINKQNKKDEKKGKTVDDAAVKKKEVAAAKAATIASAKADEKKSTSAKAKIEKKKRAALALGLITADDVTVTDQEIEEEVERVDALMKDAQLDPKTVAACNTEEGVDEICSTRVATAAVIAASPDDADALKVSAVIPDVAAAASEVTFDAADGEVAPTAEATLQYQVGGALAAGEAITTSSTIWEKSMSAAEKSAATAAFGTGLEKLDATRMAVVIAGLAENPISEATAAKELVLKLARLVQTNATVAEINAAVKALVATFTADEKSEYTDTQAEELTAEKAQDEAETTTPIEETTTTEETTETTMQ